MRVAVIGGGHNGLVSACYLAKSGCSVDLYERRPILGGLSVTEELFPNTNVSSLATRYGMIRPKIIDDLNLIQNGMKPYRCNYASHFLSNGESLTMYSGTREGSNSRIGIKGFNQKAWSKFWSDISNASTILSDMFDRDITCLEEYKNKLCDHQLNYISDSLNIESLLDFVQRFDLSDGQKSVISTMCSSHPMKIESLFEVIMLGTASAFGEVGKWGYLKGGMGAVISSLEIEARKLGVEIYTNSEVQNVTNNSKGSCEVLTLNGNTQDYDKVIFSVDPITARECFSSSGSKSLDHEKLKTDMGYTVVHFLLNSLPNIPCLNNAGREPSKLFDGQIDFTPTIDEIKVGYKSYIENKQLPISSVNFHTNMLSFTDSTVSGDNKEVWTVVLQYSVVDEENCFEKREKVIDSTIEHLSLWVEDFREIIEDVHLITPYDISSKYGVIK